MGELLLCNGPIAAMPYYLEGLAVNIYSLEELGYFIANNTYLLEKSFMSGDLCTWITREVKNEELSKSLRDIIENNGTLSEFVSAILDASGYCTNSEKKEIIDVLKEMDEKSDFECNKIRADRFMEKEKYLSSIYEYKRLLDMNSPDVPEELKGNIFHNLGCAYAKMFLFEEASNCFEKAFRLNQNIQSMKAQLFCVYCMHDKARFDGLVRGYSLSSELASDIKNEIAFRISGDQKKPKWLDDDMDPEANREEIQEVILGWKEDYRRISRT